MDNTIISLASFHSGSGRTDELGQRLGELLLCARGDTSCLGCELLRDPQQPQLWQLRGRWQSEQALQQHLQQPHMQQLGYWVGSGLVRHMEMYVEG